MIARRLNRTLEAVKNCRAKLHIPKPDSRHRRWTPDQDRLLGKCSDEQIARQTGHPVGSVSARRKQFSLTDPSKRPFGTAQEDRLLGTRPDDEVARELANTAPP